MEAVRDEKSDEKSSHEALKKVKENFVHLKRNSDEFETVLQQVNEFYIIVKKFRKGLHYKATAASVTDHSLLDTIVSVDLFVAEELEALRQSKNEMDEKIDELEKLLHDGNYNCELVAKISHIQDSVIIKLKGFQENKNVNLFRKMLETNKSE